MPILTEITSKAKLSYHFECSEPSSLTVLYFYTPWTAFSTQVGAELSRLASQYPITRPPVVSFIKINSKELLDISKEYGVRKAPCVVCLCDGKIVESIAGTDITTIRNAISNHAGSINPGVPTISAPGQLNEALITELTGLVRAAPIMVFMKGSPNSPRCRYSREFIRLLREHAIPFDWFDVLTDEDV